MTSSPSPRTATFRCPLAERQHLELDLRHNVQFARALYEDLRAEYSRHRELAAAAAKDAAVDGDLLHERCRQLHNALQAALDQYRAELHRFTRLVVDGELPE